MSDEAQVKRATVNDAPPSLLRPVPVVDAEPPPPPADRYCNRALNVGRVMAVIVTLGLIALLGRVVQVQVTPPQQIGRLIGTQVSETPLKGRRGNLLDRRGDMIATSTLAHTLFVDPFLVDDPVTFSERVAYKLDYDPAELERKIWSVPNRRFVVLDKQVSDNRLATLDSFHPAGLAVRPYLVRRYPRGDLAGQVVGFVGAEERGVEGKGLEGIERLFDEHLRGEPGNLTFLRDAKRQPLWAPRDGYEAPHDGQSVRLSLDMTIQTIAQQELAATCKEFAAESAQLVVMDPWTGEILAMANYPTFDPSNLRTAKAADWRNRCVTDVLEPGSTFKPFIWAAITDAKVASPQEIIDCGPGFWVTSLGRRLRDASGHGRLTWEHVLVESSNIGMAKAGERMGAAKLYRAVRAFGFGNPTGSMLPGEVGGIITPQSKWTHYSVTSVPMGQEIGVTPLQMATAFCAIANGGTRVTPTIIAMDVREPLASAPIYERILSQKTADETRNVLRMVVTEGTGRKIKDSAYSIFGKTGTAQVPGKTGGYMAGQYIAGFVGGAPLDRPRIIVACFVQRPDPRKGYYGGIVSAPTVQRVIEQTLIYLGVEPDVPATNTRAMIVRR